MKGDKAFRQARELNRELYARHEQLSDEQKREMYAGYLTLLKKAAYAGHPEAQFQLGQQYEDIGYWGMNNPMYNPKKSFYWYTKACAANVAEACNSLASAYETGAGCKKDIKTALALYKRATELGCKHASRNYKLMLKQVRKSSRGDSPSTFFISYSGKSE